MKSGYVQPLMALLALALVPLTAGVVGAATAPEPYVPGLGDFMTAYVQPHHVKLWLAAKGGDWPLAAYEANELRETFDDVKAYQGDWKGVPVSKLVDSILLPALNEVDATIAARDRVAFAKAYTAVTAACNTCHQAAQHGFVHIVVPATNSFPDQSFRQQ